MLELLLLMRVKFITLKVTRKTVFRVTGGFVASDSSDCLLKLRILEMF